MLGIFICEDNEIQRKRMEDVVNKHLLSDDLDMELALSADNPHDLLTYIKANEIQSGLYFLDVDLQSDINGIELAAEIKKIDLSAVVVFITTHSELVHYAFKLKVEAMEYIIKDLLPEEIEQRVVECMQVAYERFLGGRRMRVKYFTAKVGTQRVNIPYNDILFFESSFESRNKIFLHKVNGTLEFYGTIGATAKLSLPFCNIHQSFTVNVNHVKSVDVATREATVVDGTILPVAKRRLTYLLKDMEHTKDR